MNKLKEFGKKITEKVVSVKKQGVSNVVEIILILVVVVVVIAAFKTGAGEIITQGLTAVKNSITSMLGTP